MNNVVIIGRIVDDLTLIENSKLNKKAIITLAVIRNYRNSDGIFETDFFKCILIGTSAENTCKYCRKGSVVGIKGRIENRDNEMVIIAEKVTFLNNNKESEEE